jgi:hypothetical protein
MARTLLLEPFQPFDPATLPTREEEAETALRTAYRTLYNIKVNDPRKAREAHEARQHVLAAARLLGLAWPDR